LTFDQLTPDSALGRLPPHWVEDVEKLTHANLPFDTATKDTMTAVLRRNADSFYGMFSRSERGPHKLEAYFAQLLLTERGHEDLLARRINLKNPPLDIIVPTGVRPAAVYLWGVIAQRKSAIFQPYLKRKLTLLAGLPHYAALTTEAGLRAGHNMGLTAVPPDKGNLGDLFIFPPVSTLPTYDVKAKIVSDAESFEQARAIRAAVFMQEQLCPYNEEFDGNDYSAQHIIGFVNHVPAATMRVRFFAGFAKLERFAVLRPFRKTLVKDEVIKLALETIAHKGYRTVYGHAQSRLLEFWERRGFRAIPNQTEIRFSDHEYIAVQLTLPADAQSLSLRTDAMVLNRLEGAWDSPGILEASAMRPVTRTYA
jgi:predicted GNAT family N-acyltransferase